MEENQTQPVSVILPRASALLSQSWNAYKKNWKMFALVMVPMFLLSIVVNFLSEGGEMAAIRTADATHIATYAIFFIAYVVFSSWSHIALFLGVKNSINAEGTTNVTELYEMAFSKILSYWWVTFLVGIVVMFGIVLLIIPGIIFAVWYSFSPYVYIDQNIQGMAALRKSREYVKGRWGNVFCKFAYIAIVGFFASIVAAFVFKFAGIIALGLNSAFSSFVVTPVVLIFSFLLYQNLKNISSVKTVDVPVVPVE